MSHTDTLFKLKFVCAYLIKDVHNKYISTCLLL